MKVCRLPQFAAALKGSPALSFLVAWRSMVAYCGSRPATLAVKPSDLPGSARRRLLGALGNPIVPQRARGLKMIFGKLEFGLSQRDVLFASVAGDRAEGASKMQSDRYGDPSTVGFGVPAHLREHLHAPDREIFEVKAKLQALTKRFQQVEKDRDDALMVAAAADARSKATNEHASQKLEKVRTRAEAAERAAESSELLADATSAALRDMEDRAQQAEAELHRQKERVTRLEDELEKQRAIGMTLEDDVDILRRRVRNLERGISSFSKASQTTPEDFVDSSSQPEDHSFGVRAAELLRELEDVGTDAHVDDTGVVRRASVRDTLEPDGLGAEIMPPRSEVPVAVPEDDWGPDASDDEEAEQRRVEEHEHPDTSEETALIAVASGEGVEYPEHEREEHDTRELEAVEGHVTESVGVGDMEDDGWAGDDPSWTADKRQ